MADAQTGKRKRRTGKISWLLVAALFAGMFLTQNQSVADWWKLRGYDPPAAISELAADTTMTDKARHLFYLNHPEIAAKESFAKQCPSGTEKTIVLGCYKSGERGIFVLVVTDKRLDGVEQVTAAHEMLHAAYERLSGGDKKHVDELLEDFYKNGLKDQRVKDILKSYEQTEPGQQFNEMHSIFGTEIKSLPPELEGYYQQYFSDRAKVAGYAADYQSAFTSREAQIKKDDAQLASWKKQIDANELSLEARQAELENMRAQMAQYRRSDTGAYNALVGPYNAKVEAFNALLNDTKALIIQYNQLVKTRNDIALETTELQKALSGSLPTIQ